MLPAAWPFLRSRGLQSESTVKRVPDANAYPRRHQRLDRRLSPLLIAADVLVGALAYVGAFSLRAAVPLPLTLDFLSASRFVEVDHPGVLLACTQVAVLYGLGLYDVHRPVQRARLFSRVAAALSIQILLVGAWLFFRGDVFFPRSVLLVFWLLNTLGTGGVRLLFHHRLRAAGATRTLLVGTGQDIREFLSSQSDLHASHDLEIVGAISAQESDGPLPAECGVPWLGRLDDLPRLLEQVEADETILLSPTSWKDRLVDQLLNASNGQSAARRSRVLVVPSLYDVLVGRVSSLRLHDVPLVEVLKNPHHELPFLVKNAADRVLAGIVLLLALPVLGIAAGLIKLSSPGPVLYSQRRVGRNEKEFTLYKLRTMLPSAESETGPVFASDDDPRVTPVGRLLRATRIDELPQFVNILGGSMSLVGPRPERPAFVAEFRRSIPGYVERFQVKPGLTGLAQVNGDYHTSTEFKLKYDLSYIYNYSLWLDVRVLAETVKIVLTRQGV